MGEDGEIPFVLPYVFPIFFVGMWLAVCGVLAWMGGWSRMAGKYRARLKPAGKSFWMLSGSVGWVSYNNCLIARVCEEGLYLAVWPIFRFGHPPLLIPWSELHDPKGKRLLFWRFVDVSVGSPAVAKLRLPQKVFDAAGEMLGTHGGTRDRIPGGG